jgi:hypothetical protein
LSGGAPFRFRNTQSHNQINNGFSAIHLKEKT